MLDIKLLEFLILALASWRVSYMLIWEAGPDDMLLLIRKKIGIQHDDDKYPVSYPEGFLPSLFSCIRCLSIWISGIFTVSYLLHPLVCLIAALPFALSAAVIVIDSIDNNS